MPTPAAVSAADLPLTFANINPYSPDGVPPTGAPDWIWEVDHPYLHGLFAPVTEEVSADDLVVDIAGNDGTLLAEFEDELGIRVLNVDQNRVVHLLEGRKKLVGDVSRRACQ